MSATRNHHRVFLLRRAGAAVVSGLIVMAASVSGQPGGFQMPDPKQMSGMPLPTGDLPDGTISIRLIRGQLSNNIAGHPVELEVGRESRTARTDEGGRAQFSGIPAGTSVRAVATVDGERLESQVFPVPARGGVRVILVAADKAVAAPIDPGATPQPGIVSLAGDSRIIIELAEEGLQVFYLFEFENTARVPVNPPAPLAFEMPAGALNTTVLQTSTAKAAARDRVVTVTGPFSPGRTALELAYLLPYGGSSVTLTQHLPVALEQVAVIAQRAGAMRIASSNLTAQREMTAEGRQFVIASGPGLSAESPFTIELSGVPHHSRIGRYLALGFAVSILAAGFWAALRRPEHASSSRRHKLAARRELLFGHLVRLEEQRHAGEIDEGRHAARRREIMAQLERTYALLDETAAA
jgi:hypothetical protein